MNGFEIEIKIGGKRVGYAEVSRYQRQTNDTWEYVSRYKGDGNYEPPNREVYVYHRLSDGAAALAARVLTAHCTLNKTGFKPSCANCGNAENLIGVEYSYTEPHHYDGVSEWKCDRCGSRTGRWSGKQLTGDETEPPYGVKR